MKFHPCDKKSVFQTIKKKIKNIDSQPPYTSIPHIAFFLIIEKYFAKVNNDRAEDMGIWKI